MQKRSRAPHKYRKPALLVGGVFVIIVLIVGYMLWHKAYIRHRRVIPTTTVQSSDKTKTNTTSTFNDKGETATTDDTTSQPPEASGAAPDTPHGTFVSNHHPSLSGASNVPSAVQSVCLTSPGATCTIEFTKDGQSKILSTQQTDSSGATSWNWDVNSAGLTTGSWKITITASLNGKTSSATDDINLEVRP